MKISVEEFEKLQAFWYKRLEQQGFKDIETDKNPLGIFIPTFEESQRDYFSVLYEIANDEKTTFKNDVHKYILRRYSEGARIKQIVDELVIRETPRERKSIRFIIRRYEMAWGIRFYTSKQLNVKT